MRKQHKVDVGDAFPLKRFYKFVGHSACARVNQGDKFAVWGWGVWQAAKRIYKLAEDRHDAEFFGVLGWRFDAPFAAIFERAGFTAMLAMNRDIMIRTFVLVGAFAIMTRIGSSMGPLALDETLALGEYRELTDKEKQQLFAAVRLSDETNR